MRAARKCWLSCEYTIFYNDHRRLPQFYRCILHCNAKLYHSASVPNVLPDMNLAWRAKTGIWAILKIYPTPQLPSSYESCPAFPTDCYPKFKMSNPHFTQLLRYQWCYKIAISEFPDFPWIFYDHFLFSLTIKFDNFKIADLRIKGIRFRSFRN